MLTVFKDRESLSLAAATLFADEARRAAAKKERFTVFLSGGDTPRRTYQLLAQDPLVRTVPWEALEIFWGDERYLPHEDPRSNFRMVREALLDHLSLSGDQVHPVPYFGTPAEAAEIYQQGLRSHLKDHPPIDLVLLGLGDDGHTASLFPHSEVLQDKKRWVAELYLPEQEMYRVTVTPNLLNQAAVVLFLVSGSAKAEVLQRVLEGPRNPQELPAQLIDPIGGKLLWFVDRDAARLLTSTKS
jgi:6-phosphogluconolactonase